MFSVITIIGWYRVSTTPGNTGNILNLIDVPGKFV